MPQCTVKEVETAGELALAAQTNHPTTTLLCSTWKGSEWLNHETNVMGGVSSLQQEKPVYYRELIHEAFKKHEQLLVATKKILWRLSY